jgi:hypothetical protein
MAGDDAGIDTGPSLRRIDRGTWPRATRRDHRSTVCARWLAARAHRSAAGFWTAVQSSTRAGVARATCLPPVTDFGRCRLTPSSSQAAPQDRFRCRCRRQRQPAVVPDCSRTTAVAVVRSGTEGTVARTPRSSPIRPR